MPRQPRDVKRHFRWARRAFLALRVFSTHTQYLWGLHNEAQRFAASQVAGRRQNVGNTELWRWSGGGQEISASVSPQVESSANLTRGWRRWSLWQRVYHSQPKGRRVKRPDFFFSFKKGPNDVFMIPGTMDEQIYCSVHAVLLPERRPAILSTRGNILLTCIDPPHCQVTRLHLD